MASSRGYTAQFSFDQPGQPGGITLGFVGRRGGKLIPTDESSAVTFENEQRAERAAKAMTDRLKKITSLHAARMAAE